MIEKPVKFQLYVPQPLLDRVDTWRGAQPGVPNRSGAVRWLIDFALQKIGEGQVSQAAPAQPKLTAREQRAEDRREEKARLKAEEKRKQREWEIMDAERSRLALARMKAADTPEARDAATRAADIADLHAGLKSGKYTQKMVDNSMADYNKTALNIPPRQAPKR